MLFTIELDTTSYKKVLFCLWLKTPVNSYSLVETVWASLDKAVYQYTVHMRPLVTDNRHC